MTYQTVTTLSAAEVLIRAKRFFAERIPLAATFPEKEGPTFLVLRGQGGEEIAIAVTPAPGGHLFFGYDWNSGRGPGQGREDYKLGGAVGLGDW